VLAYAECIEILGTFFAKMATPPKIQCARCARPAANLNIQFINEIRNDENFTAITITFFIH
jgi:hypothetical protein